MLIVSVFALGVLVAPLSVFAALGLLAGAFGAALADGDEPPPPRQGTTSPRRMA